MTTDQRLMRLERQATKIKAAVAGMAVVLAVVLLIGAGQDQDKPKVLEDATQNSVNKPAVSAAVPQSPTGEEFEQDISVSREGSSENDLVLWTVCAQIVTTFIILGMLVVSMIQLRVMRESSSSSQFLALVQFLQDPDVRTARDHVLGKLKTKNFDKWDKDDRSKAATVCSSYGTAGVLVKHKLIQKSLLEGYGPSLKKCFGACKPLIENRRKVHGAKYWNNFDWLCENI